MTPQRTNLFTVLVVMMLCNWPTWWCENVTAVALKNESSSNISVTYLRSSLKKHCLDGSVCPPCPWRKKTPFCSAVLDLGFVMEASASVEKHGRGNFKRLLQFIGSVIQKFPISPKKTRVGVVTFGAKTDLLFGFQRYSSVLPALITLHHAQSYSHTSSRTGHALLFAERYLFRQSKRRRVPQVLVVITDGKSTDDVIIPSQRLKAGKVIIYGVGVGRYFSIKQLDQMASRPLHGNIFTGQFNKLQHIRDALVRSVCLGVGGVLQIPGKKPCLCKEGKLRPGCKIPSNQVKDCAS